MPLDGITIKCLKNELGFLSGAKINKISQPKKLDLVINIYKNKNYKLFITANASSPRINFIDKAPENPLVPPNFCMLLRKHLQGGTIRDIDQYKLDRVLKINIDTYDEMGYPVVKSLIVEIMGRHSNIILTDENNKIIDSIVRVNSSMSRVREILPGKTYWPLEDEKINILEEDILPSQLIDTESNSQFYKLFQNSYTGFSPAIGKEVSFRSHVDPLKASSLISEDELKDIDKSFITLVDDIKSNNFTPSIVFSNDLDKLLDFHSFELTYLDGKIKNYSSISEVLSFYYPAIIKTDKLRDKKANLQKVVKEAINHQSEKIRERKLGIEKAKERDIYKVYADVLSANFHKLSGGEEILTVNNFYDENFSEIDIPLDPTLSGPLNAQRFYKKYSKLKNREKIFSKDLPKLEDELDYLQQIDSSFDIVDSIEDLEEIEDELLDEGYIKKNQKSKSKDSKDTKSKPLQFKSSQGETIYVGKNNKQNDYITLKLANKNDYFFHVQNYPGSHVILKTDKEVSEESILEAAYLAAKNSSLSKEALVSVDYTQKKNVYKAKGAKPGMVYYNDFSTVIVDMEDSNISKIINNKMD